MSLLQFSEEYTPLIREALREQVSRIEQPTLRAASLHLIGRGKLFRPLLCLACFQSISGAEARQVVRVACSFELIHTFSLIHDDLPCMDDADMRRGVPSVHLRYGEALAVLSGDLLLSLAINEIATADVLDSERRLALAICATQATQTVVEGQVMDLEGEGRMMELSELQAIHSRKTGALIAACCEGGAILAGANNKLCSRLREIGELMGMAFQIRDDLLSVQVTEAQAGKSLGSDVAKDKATYPRIIGVSASEKQLEHLSAVLEQAISGLPLADCELLLNFARSAIERET